MARATAARTTNDGRQPRVSMAIAATRGMTRVPAPMPATAKPEAIPRRRMNQRWTTPTAGT